MQEPDDLDGYLDGYSARHDATAVLPMDDPGRAAPLALSPDLEGIDGELDNFAAREAGITLGDLNFRHLPVAEALAELEFAEKERGIGSAIIPSREALPYIGYGFTLTRQAEALLAKSRMDRGKADADDERLYLSFLVDAARESSTGAGLLDAVWQIAGTIGEVYTGGVAVSGAKIVGKKALKAAGQQLFSEAMEKAAAKATERVVGKIALEAAPALVATYGLQEAIPRLLGEAGVPGMAEGGAWTLRSVETLLGRELSPEEHQEIVDAKNALIPVLLEKAGGLGDGMIRQGISMAAEGTGAALGLLPIVKQIDMLTGMIFVKMAGKTAKGQWGKRVLEMAQQQGLGSEGMEEVVDAVGQSAIMGDKPLAEALLEVAEQMPEMMGAMAILRGGMAGATRIGTAKPKVTAGAAGAVEYAFKDGQWTRGGEVVMQAELQEEIPASVLASPAEGTIFRAGAPVPAGKGGEVEAAPSAEAGGAAAVEEGEVPSARPLPEAELEAGGIRGALSARPIGQQAAGQASIGRGLTGTKKPTTDKTTNIVRIMDALADTVEAAGGDTPIRSGRVRTKWAAGHFDVSQETIELLKSNDIDVATHEVAHAIDKHIFGRPGGRKPHWTASGGAGITPAAELELMDLGRQLYGARIPNGGYKSEGFAEYVRLWAMQGGAQNTPELDAWFTGTFLPKNPAVAKRLESVRALSETWRLQGSVNRGREMIVREERFSERARKVRRAVESGAVAANVYDQWVEGFGPHKRAAQEAARKKGSALPIERNPFEVASAWRFTAPARARYMAEHGMIDLAGNVTGPALIEVGPLVKGRYEDFVVYLYARRAKALIEDPKATQPGGRDPGISIEDANQIITEMGSPEFTKAADLVYKWNEGLLDYMAQASPTLAMAVEAIRKRDPGAYLPLQREFDEIRERGKGGGKAAVDRGSVTQRLRGSGRRVKDPFPRMLEAAERRIKLAHERYILEQVVAFRDIEGMGHLIEEVPVDRVPAATRSVGQLLDEIARKSPSLFARQNLGNAVFAEGISDADAITFFEQSFQPTKADETPIIPIIDQGKIRYFRIGDPDLYKSLEGLDIYRLPRFLDWIFGVPKRMFVSGVTSLSASFGLIANPARDFPTYMANTQAANPIAAAAGWTQMAGHMFATAATGGKYRPEWMEVYERLGVNMSRRLSADSAPTRRAARRIAGHKVVDLHTPGDMLDLFRDMIQFPEGAPRMAEMRTVAERVGWAPGMPMTVAQSIEIALAGKRVTTDFSAAGRLARIANAAIPFFNVAIQGPRAAARALRDHPLRFSGVAFTMMTMPVVALWLMQNDDDWYEELSDEEKYTHFYYRVGDEVFRFPRAHDIGFVFASLPEILLNRWKQDDPKAAVEWARSLIGATTEASSEAWRVLVPDALPVPVGLAAEQLANRSFFWDSPIVARGLEDRPAEEQFNDYTSQASIAIGEAMGLSPQRVEHTIKYLTGTVGSEILQMFGRGIDDVDLEPELADTAIIGRLFRRGGAEGGRSASVNRLFDLSHEMTVRSRSTRREEEPAERTERLMVQDATKAIAALSHARALTKLEADRRALSAKASSIARSALRAVEAGTTSGERSGFARERNAAERLEEQRKRDLERLRAGRP